MSAFYLAAWFVPLLPRAAVVGLSKGLGFLAYCISRRARRLGIINLDHVFGQSKTPNEKRAILKGSFNILSLTVLDMFWFAGYPERRIPKFQHFEPCTGPFFEQRPQIVITAHAGNWELAGLHMGLMGLNLASIASTTKNSTVDRLFTALRQRTGQIIIPREGALRSLISRLRSSCKVAFLLDQNTKETEGGIWVNMLGTPMPISSAPALLAYKTGADIIFVFSQPNHGGTYTVHNGNLISPPRFDNTHNQKQIIQELTQRIADTICEHIRQHPENWLWSYKYWRYKAPESWPASYPAYE